MLGFFFEIFQPVLLKKREKSLFHHPICHLPPFLMEEKRQVSLLWLDLALWMAGVQDKGERNLQLMNLWNTTYAFICSIMFKRILNIQLSFCMYILSFCQHLTVTFKPSYIAQTPKFSPYYGLNFRHPLLSSGKEKVWWLPCASEKE